MKDLCVRCGKETAYDINTPITVRFHYVEGAGHLCEECFAALFERNDSWHINSLESKSAPDADINING